MVEPGCHESASGTAIAEIEATISDVSGPKDVIIFSGGSVKRGEKSGLAFTARINGNTVLEGSGAVKMIASIAWLWRGKLSPRSFSFWPQLYSRMQSSQHILCRPFKKFRQTCCIATGSI